MKKRIYIISFIVFIIDFIIKRIVECNIELDSIIVIINNFFNITKVYNTGGAWSIMTNMTFLLSAVSFIILFFIIKSIDTFKLNNRNIIGFGLLIGGIFGNLFDRLVYNHVIDYLSLKFGNYYFPVFNLADSCIVIGVILLIIAIIKKEDNDENKSK